MSKERLEELLNDLPYTIRHSGELEPLKQFAREQAELVSKHETRINNLTFDLASSRVQNKRYREAKKQIEEKYEYFQDIPSSITTGLSIAIKILDKALEGED